jgi:hypothetical protein
MGVSMSEFVPETCFKCGVVFGMPRVLYNTCRRDRQGFYCPNGHGQAYAISEADELRAKLQKQEQATAAAKADAERERRWRLESREEARTLERRLAAQRGVATRMKNRVANGVCPCCNRSFTNLRRHMEAKHKGFVAEEVQADGVTIQ